MRLNRLDNQINRTERNKLNENFNIIEQTVNDIEDEIETIFKNGVGGGDVPSNVILFEDWTPGESVIIGDSPAPPTDTTAPILTITPGGNFNGTKTITMTTNETATIYYTLDNSTPTTNSPRYTSPLTISATTTLKAFARDTAGNNSVIQTVNYTLVSNTGDTTAPILTITPSATFTDTQTVTMSTNEAATIYYTLDGTTPTQTSPVYSTPLTLSATTTVKAFAKDAAGNVSVVQTIVYTKTVPPVNGVLFEDTFNRADNDTGLGVTDSGHTWTPFTASNGTTIHGIKDNAFYYVGGTDTRNNAHKRMAQYVLNTNSYTLETSIPTSSTSTAPHAIGLRITLNSSTNYIYLIAAYANATVKYQLVKLVSGSSVETLGLSTVTTKKGDNIKVNHHSNGLIEVFINDNLEISVTDSFKLSTNTVIGLGLDTVNTGLFESIKITSL